MAELSDVLSIPDTTCFACGARRRGVVSLCPVCGKRPIDTAEWRKALGANGYPLGDQLHPSAERDARYDNPVFRAVNQRSLEQSLADKQLQELLSLDGQGGVSHCTAPAEGESADRDRATRLPSTCADTLAQNPFFLLGATITQPVVDIESRASEVRNVSGEPVTAQSVCDTKLRLQAEIRWLGDLAVSEAQSLIRGDTQALPSDPLASVNVQYSRLLDADSADAASVASAVVGISDTWAKITAENTLTSLNTWRRLAGAPAIANEAVVGDALVERQGEIVAGLLGVLDSMPADALLESYEAFAVGTRTPAKVVVELVKHYRDMAEPVMLGEGDKVVALCRRGAIQLRSGEQLAPDFVGRLGSVMTLYHRLLKPLRTSPQGMGAARTLSQMMREAFSELCEASEQFANSEQTAALSRLQNTYFKRR